MFVLDKILLIIDIYKYVSIKKLLRICVKNKKLNNYKNILTLGNIREVKSHRPILVHSAQTHACYNARTFNFLLKTFSGRQKENGENPKKIIIVVMRKLIHQIYETLKSGEPYNPEKRGLQFNSKPLTT